jgi:hypothetical protein
MLSANWVGRLLRNFGAVAAVSFLFSVQGCASLPFGHRSEADPTGPAAAASVKADGVNASAAGGASVVGAAPATVIASASGAATGVAPPVLGQTTTLQGGVAESGIEPGKIATPIGLAVSNPLGQGGAVTQVATTIPIGAAGAVNAEIKRFTFHSAAERAQYEKAAARFPDFCHEWQRMLHDRELNNLRHLTWMTRQGTQSSTYTGYGQVQTCLTKESVEGVPIGKLSYDETIYSISGKNADEARHAPPRIIHQTRTLEIFSWDKNKWFY